MKLVRARIRNYRSFGGDNTIDFTTGVNCIVGPNNAGKSNLFNAIATALDDQAAWSRDDLPSFMLGGRPPVPKIDLHFETEGRVTSPERTLLKRAEAYERRVGSTRTYAEDGEIRLSVSLLGDSPTRTFTARGAGARVAGADTKEFQDLDAQFRRVVRFVMIRSGESLESLLAGRFREILHLVISEHLYDERTRADVERERYQQLLQTGLLDPLRERVQSVVGRLFPEIRAVDLIPDVPSVDHTLGNVEVRLDDTAHTDMQRKGTGVRGAVLAAMLQYLADQTRRSMVFAVEEPEAFLHPAAQEDLRESLESLATRNDVTLMVTTHSPFIVSHRPESQVIEVRKDGQGLTKIAKTAPGDAENADLLGGLFRDAGLPRLINRALSVPPGTRAVVITEGQTDVNYLRIAAQTLGRPDQLAGIHFIPAHGASKVVLQCMLSQGATVLPVIAILDHDDNGRSARDQLRRFQWTPKKQILMLDSCTSRTCGHDVEAEDLWPAGLMRRLVRDRGEDATIDGKTRCGQDWHYSVAGHAKDEVLDWIRRHATAADAADWKKVLDALDARITAMA